MTMFVRGWSFDVSWLDKDDDDDDEERTRPKGRKVDADEDC